MSFYSSWLIWLVGCRNAIAHFWNVRFERDDKNRFQSEEYASVQNRLDGLQDCPMPLSAMGNKCLIEETPEGHNI